MKTKLKVITYNIDGLPDKLDLNDLPTILKPITWIYRLIKKTSIIKINDNSDTNIKITNISSYLSGINPDLIGVQEDFNYHDNLMTNLSKYKYGTISEKFSLKNLFSKVEFKSYFPLPRFKSDGINLLTNNDTIFNDLSKEDIVFWEKSNGYISHANDLLTHKGFRFYEVNILDEAGKKTDLDIDVYVLHMDADFYHPENCPNVTKDIEARKSQLQQLTSYIFDRFYYKRDKINPIIIMGDTNSYDKYEWDKINLYKYLICPFEESSIFKIQECKPDNYSDCDRIYIINNIVAKYKLELDNCSFNKDLLLSDHKPLEANFNITLNEL